MVSFLKYVEDPSYADGKPEDTLIQKINSKIKEIKQKSGMEVQYMLFGEMLDDERKEAQDNLLYLMASMEAKGEADKIPLLWKNTEFLQEMYQKYHIEA